MKFGDNLKLIRKMRKVSQEELADKLGVSRQSVSKWETGENYPSMQNIVCLCSIFKCKMNDLVHEDFEDLDFMDEEIKMNVVKLNEKEQKNIKVLSKILFMIGRIGKILTRVGIGFVVVAMIFIALFIHSVDVKDDQLVVNGDIIKITELNDGVRLSTVKNEHIIISDLSSKDVENIKNAYKTYNKTVLVILIELGLVVLIAFLTFVSKSLNRMEQLFINIHDGDTPFTLENVDHMKKMAIYMIIAIILSSIGSTIINVAISRDEVFEFNLFNITEIIFIYAMSLVFEYGYRIQKDSKGKMYN